MKKILTILLSFLLIFSYALVYADGMSKAISGGVIRFHIIANSDSEYDQSVKIKVRDYVSENLKEITPNGNFLKTIESLANQKLLDLGADYRAKARYEWVYIPKKEYKNLKFPSGRYEAVRLILGKGDGENWWCVAYPSLCFSESVSGSLSKSGEEKLKNSLSPDSFDIVTGKKEYKFFLVDFIEHIKETLLKGA